MTDDKELIARLRSMHWCVTTKANGVGVSDEAVAPEAADRIEELIEESSRRLALARSEGVARVEQFERNEALTEQLADARQDAKEAEAYAEELKREQKGWQEAAVKLMNKLIASEAKLAKAVEEAEKYQRAFAAQSRKLQAVLHIEGVRTTLAEIKGESHDPL